MVKIHLDDALDVGGLSNIFVEAFVDPCTLEINIQRLGFGGERYAVVFESGGRELLRKPAADMLEANAIIERVQHILRGAVPNVHSRS